MVNMVRIVSEMSPTQLCVEVCRVLSTLIAPLLPVPETVKLETYRNKIYGADLSMYINLLKHTMNQSYEKLN